MPNKNELAQNAMLAVTKFTHEPSNLIDVGKQSYWAYTFIVESNGKKYFVKQTTNSRKAENSRQEPVITQLLQEHGIPCPLAHVFYGESELGEKSLATIVYDYQKVRGGKLCDGDDLIEGGHKVSNGTGGTIGNMLGLINSIPTTATKRFDRGSLRDHVHIASASIAKSPMLSEEQKKKSLKALDDQKAKKIPIGLHHMDYYPANLLFELIKSPQLTSVADWEKAEFAPLGTDFLGLIAISSQLSFNPDLSIEAYRSVSRLSPADVKKQLITFGLVQAIALDERVQQILKHDPEACSDSKVKKFQKWLNDYVKFAFSYE